MALTLLLKKYSFVLKCLISVHLFKISPMIMRKVKIFSIFLISMLSHISSAQELVVFSDIPSRTPSDKYTCRVRQVGSNVWNNAFVLQTISSASPNPQVNGYVSNLANWSASWIAFEFSGTPVEVEISKVGGASITKGMVRPVGHASAATVSNGKIYVTFNQAANINVDIDGQMEDQYTGMGYTGPPVHTISIFANPVFKKPILTNPRVYQLNPGDAIPANTTWDTLVFNPGIHRIGQPYEIASNKVLYIPGDAVVHGTINPPNLWGNSAAVNWSVYGSGTLSSEEVARNTAGNKPFTYQASGVRLEGFVIADPAHHTLNMNNSNFTDLTKANIYKNLKILGWRINGDGLNAFRNSIITDCFFRCQDDHFYYGGDDVKISNCVNWSDYNGAVVYVTKGGTTTGQTYFRDIKVIYHRAGWHYWQGGRVISFRDRQPGNVIKNVEIKNVLIEDPFPAFPPFYFRMTNPNSSAALMDYDNILIENVVQRSLGVSRSNDANLGKPRNSMLGLDATRKFANITFKNCAYNNVPLGSYADGDFATNSFDQNVVFLLDGVLPLTLLKFSGYSKENNAFLAWETSDEKNTSHFEIERSTDGLTYKKVGEIKCRNNATGVNKYTFSDAMGTPNAYLYYRLKQVDNGEKFKYSTIISIKSNDSDGQSLLIFPNPANNVINIDSENGFQIYNAMGQMVKENKQKTVQINISDLPDGVYLLKTSKEVRQFIKAK